MAVLQVSTAISQVTQWPFTEAQTAAIRNWGDTFHIIMYLFILFVAMVVYYEFKWAHDCDTKISILIIHASGHCTYDQVEVQGGSIQITNPKTKVVKLWPINELATIIVPYPGVSFIPRALQKEIREVIVTEEDWEPITNRSPHRKNIVSPDVLDKLKIMRDTVKAVEITEGMKPEDILSLQKDKSRMSALDELITTLEENASTYPTRDMIASPEVLGNVMNERITAVVTALGASLMSKIEDVIKQLTRLGKPINSTIVYALLGVCIIASVAGIFMSVNSQKGTKDDLAKIKNALGISETAPMPSQNITIQGVK